MMAKQGEAVLALRPERLRVAPGGDGLAGRVLFTTYLGVMTEYQIELASGERLIVRQPALEANVAAGDPVRVHWTASAALMLPAA